MAVWVDLEHLEARNPQAAGPAVSLASREGHCRAIFMSATEEGDYLNPLRAYQLPFIGRVLARHHNHLR